VRLGIVLGLEETPDGILLLSRRDERDWLGDLPERVWLQPMPLPNRAQLARTLAVTQGWRLAEVENWRPLLEFTEGNPLTITAVTGRALREGCRTPEQVAGLGKRLASGNFDGTAKVWEMTDGRKMPASRGVSPLIRGLTPPAHRPSSSRAGACAGRRTERG
jgi:hypothetical protein